MDSARTEDRDGVRQLHPGDLVDRESAAVLVGGYLAGGTLREVAAHQGVSTKLVQRATSNSVRPPALLKIGQVAWRKWSSWREDRVQELPQYPTPATVRRRGLDPNAR